MRVTGDHDAMSRRYYSRGQHHDGPVSRSHGGLKPDYPDRRRYDRCRAGAGHTGLGAAGGGWGDPLERDPDLVRWDVVEGFMSLQAAREAYGVVLDPDDLSLDRQATDELQAELRATAAPNADQGPFLEPSEPAE